MNLANVNLIFTASSAWKLVLTRIVTVTKISFVESTFLHKEYIVLVIWYNESARDGPVLVVSPFDRRVAGNASMNHARLPPWAKMDLWALQLLQEAQHGVTVERNQAQVSQSSCSTTSPFLQPQHHTSISTSPHCPVSSAIQDIVWQENELRRPLPHEQAIQDAILMLHYNNTSI